MQGLAAFDADLNFAHSAVSHGRQVFYRSGCSDLAEKPQIFVQFGYFLKYGMRLFGWQYIIHQGH